jgi:hypothetical protein
MARPSKIVQQKLEDKALQGRNEGLSAQATADRLNAVLKRRGAGETVSERTVDRYWTILDRTTIAPAHQPQNAEQNAALAINVGGDLQRLAATLRAWFEEAQEARVYQFLYPEAEKDEPAPEPLRIDLGPDWKVRLDTSREFRETLKFAADVLERIYNAEQIQVFQATVMECVAAADPVVASEIRRRLGERQEIVRAQLLGV